MNILLNSLKTIVDDIDSAPTLQDMPKRTLSDKGIAGATAAHVIEEVHTPFNFSYITFTTGSSAFQNIVGVTESELQQRQLVAEKIMAQVGGKRGDHALITYAPLVNVFSANALRSVGISWNFLKRSGRDAFILSLCEDKPKFIIGESSFIYSTLIDAASLGFYELLPRDCIVLCAGTPLKLELIELASQYGWQIHDLYGCQEFGWLTLDGIPLRDDISMIPSPIGGQYHEMLAGGLPLADSFPISSKGHVCNREGKIISYQRKRTNPEYEVYVTGTTFPTIETISRVARTILRIKGRVVKISPHIKFNTDATELTYFPSVVEDYQNFSAIAVIKGPEKTRLFDSIIEAQLQMQSSSKQDPAWIKGN